MAGHSMRHNRTQSRAVRTLPVYTLFLLLSLLVPVISHAQTGTLAPQPYLMALDNNGAIINGGKLCTYSAGTSTPVATYSDSGLSTPNTNPVVASSAGRLGPIYLSPGKSYKFVLRSPGTDATCSTGYVFWTQDNISAVPGSSSTTDVTGIAGEALISPSLVYLSNTGQWFKADSSAPASSTTPIIGMVLASAKIYESISVRLIGVAPASGFVTPGTTYYVGASGAISDTPGAYSRMIGVADTSSSVLLDNAYPAPDSAPQWRHLAGGRLTLENGVPVSTTNQSAKATIYYTPSSSTSIALYASSVWVLRTFVETSLSVAACSASKPYDVFAYDNAGTLALEQVVWSSTSTRATAITTQDGVRVKTGDATRRYLGSYQCDSGGGTTSDTLASRGVWNNDNRVQRPLEIAEGTASWSTTGSSSWASTHALATNRVNAMIGWADTPVWLDAGLTFITTGNTSMYATGIGYDSTSSPLALGARSAAYGGAGATPLVGASHRVLHQPDVGYHAWYWLEYSGAASTAYGTSTPIRSALSGWIAQ